MSEWLADRGNTAEATSVQAELRDTLAARKVPEKILEPIDQELERLRQNGEVSGRPNPRRGSKK